MEIIIKVNSTYNNTIVSALYRGKIFKTISTGSLGFKKAKRASTLAAQTCGEALGSWLLQLNKNITLAQRSRKVGSAEVPNSVLEYSVLQEAKKKVAASKTLAGTKKGAKDTKESNLGKGDVSEVSMVPEISAKGKAGKANGKPGSNPFIIKQVSLLVSGVGYGKFGVIRGLAKVGIKIHTISDVTAVPHNGCKPPKMRRK